MWLSHTPIPLEARLCGGDCYRELPRISILRTWVNRSGLPYLRAKHSGYVVPCKIVTVVG
jgi:hypothetical protein